MESRELSKMQVRAEVMMILQQIYSHEEIPKDAQDKYLNQMSSIFNRELVIDILVKELSRVDHKKGYIITFFLSELGNLEQLKEVLWNYIKDPKISDDVKDLAGIILRNLGDDSDPNLFLSYLNDPKEVIDKETKKILEVALVNPEAQIDFLDFLFSLPEEDQINLVTSLKGDYTGEYLANILITALDSKPSDNLTSTLIDALGETKSPLAVPVLNNLMMSDKSDHIKKLVKKSLNMLKLSGVNLESSKADYRGMPICQISKIHECYASIVDGVGNQGFIISRLKDNRDILMFSVVVNDFEGIVDCFGFNGISQSDFARIILRFQENSTRVSVPPEYCKYILSKAEQINNENNKHIPYEYIAWKSLLFDIPVSDEKFEETAISWGDLEYISQGDALYKHPDFEHWFIDDEDHPVIKESLEKIIDNTMSNSVYFAQNVNKFINYLEEQVSLLIPKIFDEKTREIYKNRLLNVSYLMDFQGLSNFKKIASSIALEISNNKPLEKSPFIREYMRRTVSEGFLRYQHNLEQQNKFSALSSNEATKCRELNKPQETVSIDQNLNKIINILYDLWQKS